MNKNMQNDDNELINIREELDKYLMQWKWFLLTVSVSVFIGFLYTRYASPQYKVTSTLIIEDEQSSVSSEISAFQDLGVLGGSYSNIMDEIQILKSRSLGVSVIKDLKLNINYYEKGVVKESEVYNKAVPFELVFVDSLNLLKKLDTSFYAKYVSNNEVQIMSHNEEFVDFIEFDEEFYIDQVKAVIYKTAGFNPNMKYKETRISVKPYNKIIGSFVNGIEIDPISDQSNVLKLSMKHSVRSKAKDILNKLMHNYIGYGISNKNEVGKRTAEFINQRIKIIENDLEIVDRKAESYKKENNLTNVESQSELFTQKVSENEAAIFETSTQIQLVEFMRNYVQEIKGSYELLPANLGFTDQSLMDLLGDYNLVVLERSRILVGSSDQNPIIRNLENELNNYQHSILASLENVKSSLNISLNELKLQDIKFSKTIDDIPTMEREYSNIQREQGIKAALYLYLLQKKEENEISLAVTKANSRVIDVAYGSSTPFAPRKKIILLASLFFGLILPFVVIYLKDLLGNKVISRKDLESVLNVPVLGDIPLKESDENIVISKGARSSSAEAFRLLRTNLDFLLAGNKNKCKTILLSSTVSGEGKSFISINLACSLVLSGKKVALLGMDLRAPKIIEYLDVSDKKGITNYIMDNSLTTENIKIQLPEHKGLDIYASGVIPPNPAELLMHSRVDELFDKIKGEYDYVIVDTAPVNLVSDTLLIADRADLFIYVTRANYLDKRLLEVPKNLHLENRLPNMAMLLNGTDYSKGYGYGGYGAYGYGHVTKKTWKEKLFKN